MSDWWNDNIQIIGFGEDSEKLKEKIKDKIKEEVKKELRNDSTKHDK